MVRPFRFAVTASKAPGGAAWTELARRVEDAGVSTLNVPDHYVDAASNGGQSLAAVPMMAAAAAVTSTLRLGARVFCIDYHEPVVLAKTAATLDLLSDGRLELGLGAGWVSSEYQAMGLQMDSAGIRLDRLVDTVAFLDQFFSGEPIDAQVGGVHITGFRGEPRPVQQPRPPIMIGGGAQRVLTLAGRLADIVSFNFDNRAGVVGPQAVRSALGPLMEQRLAWVREGAGDRFDQVELEMGAYFVSVTDQAIPAAEKFGSAFGLSAEEMLEHPNTLIGSVDAICDRLIERRERYGLSYIAVAERNLTAFRPVIERLVGR